MPVEPRTFDLLRVLARNAGRTVTRDELFDEVWGDRIVSDAALSSQVRAARRALGDDGSAQEMIATVHGRGFRLRGRADQMREEPQDVAAATGRTGRPTIAVLPCVSLDRDGRGAVLAQGLVEDLITALSKTRWLRVVPRSTMIAVGGAADNPADVAAATGADYLVSGTVRRDGNRVRISVQTADARDMRCIWSESFDRDMADIFALQDEISRLVSARIATELGVTEQERAAREPRKNRGAWEIYQLGSLEFYRFTAESNRRCQRLMRQAIEQDPAFGSAYARLAYAVVLEMVYFEGERHRARLDEALDLARRGVDCDDQDAATFFVLGRVRLARCEYELAMDALEEALRLDPCLALAHCGMGDSLAYEGRLDEAIERFETAIELSPHDPFRWAFMSYRSLAHLFDGAFEDAARWARRATQLPNAHYWANANLVAALGHCEAGRQAEEAVQALSRMRPGFSRRLARDRLFYVKDGDQIEAFLEGLRKAGVK
ncbi:winged helix-turn-helix domain-containing tetratricopeptide repeat protein [Salinarimonas rosea]|uniref:winged helix-turn-helix domain-containing tetratricopeptide repeat protein n=1 Tax=Salinarimonas rosea TaxID=552063 RepID=UPI00146FA837|nr:winged helix-turn-helix domain-containing protein [Salinarimonas rosea]